MLVCNLIAKHKLKPWEKMHTLCNHACVQLDYKTQTQTVGQNAHYYKAVDVDV